MSKFFSSKFSNLTPYVPGEQPRDMKYIKLNTNESPFAPSKEVYDAVKSEAELIELYSDPESKALTDALAKVYKVDCKKVIMTNGSDEVLNFAFMAFADESNPLYFADITYGFYPVFAKLNHIPYNIIPLESDFTLDYKKFCGVNGVVVIANPNAPTGISIPLWQVEEIVKSNPNSVVIIDEAYVDFGGESAVSLIDKYENLLVTQTFSKSRSMAGARIGFGIANEKIIADLNTIKYSTNPYNVNRLSSTAGIKALENNDYYMNNCKIIMETRKWTTCELEKLGFSVLPSSSNFVFAKSDRLSGSEVYFELKNRGILVRHFDLERIKEYNRITIGSKEQMESLIETLKLILEETN